MSEILVPEELFERHKEVWKRTKHGNFVGKDMGEEEFFLLLMKDELTLENFFRKECLEKGNTPIYQKKNFTGELFNKILNDLAVAIKSGKLDTKNLIEKVKTLIIDSTEFLKEQAKTDGLCLSLLFSNAKELFILREVEESYKLFDEALQLYKTLDLSALYWGDTTSSVFFFEGFVNGVLLSIKGETEEDDLVLFEAFNKWSTPVLKARGEHKLLCTSYYMHYFPINWSYFNKMCQRFWDNKSISEMETFKVFYTLEILKVNSPCVKHPTDERVMTLHGGDDFSMQMMRKWSVHLSPTLLATNYKEVVKTIRALKKHKLLKSFISDLQEEYKDTEDVFKLLGAFSPAFFIALKELGNTEINDIFEDKLLKAGFPLVAHEITGKEYKDMNESLSARVLTLTTSKENPEATIFFNQKEGSAEVRLDWDEGRGQEWETWIIEFSNHIGTVPLNSLSPTTVSIGRYETARVTPK